MSRRGRANRIAAHALTAIIDALERNPSVDPMAVLKEYRDGLERNS